MRAILSTVLLLAALAAPGTAGAADSWGLPNEEKARFDAKVVDMLCELTGDCPADCGAGTRQLGLLMDDGQLILPLKNQVPFAGAADDLAGFCGKTVTADGLFSTNRGHKIFALQFVREAPDGKWQRANRFLPNWAAANGVDAKSPEAQEWFRNDPQVKALIAEQGKLGLGPEADKKFLGAQ
ncbi:MAG TPA: hypothetical protein VGA60_06820 [Kiloniellales bacterium]|jgi:hypothetical protein